MINFTGNLNLCGKPLTKICALPLSHSFPPNVSLDDSATVGELDNQSVKDDEAIKCYDIVDGEHIDGNGDVIEDIGVILDISSMSKGYKALVSGCGVTRSKAETAQSRQYTKDWLFLGF
ncbi:hypothetical protein QVD17_16332 [Tagetes erecta]|uniref:Uncharacterized protein n=1 Tax=Tagetes erecta TaxID=13708 RepID=A0AAD8KUZ2_TARER|nr:hypothetical protein QVD17_16332 [Tagetes erecta]